jgi:hypothetical protein
MGRRSIQPLGFFSPCRIGFRCQEWDTIRIGTTPTAENLGQNATFIAGIYGHGTDWVVC